MAMLKFVPRFLKVDPKLYQETIDWLTREYKGKTIILAYEIDPNEKLDVEDEAVFAAKTHCVQKPGDNTITYNIGFGTKKAKGTPGDPNGL